MRGVRVALVLALGATTVSIAAAATGDPAPPRQSSATALVAQVTVPGQPTVATTLYTAPPVVNGGGAFAHPADGSILRIGAATTTATAQPGISSSAEASVRALAVTVLGGEISAQSITVRVGAAAGPAGATGDVGRSAITGLVVLGQPVTPSGNIQLPLADWGTLDVLGASSSTSDEPRSAESSVTGLRIRINAEHAGLPAGTEIVVGATTAQAVAQAAPTTPAKPKPTTPDHGTTGLPGRRAAPATRAERSPRAGPLDPRARRPSSCAMRRR